MKKIIGISAAVVGVAAAVAAGIGINYAGRVVQVGAGYKAKSMCQGVFVSGRTEQHVIEHDFAGSPDVFNRINVEVDRSAQEVRAWLGPFPKQRSVYRPGYGCTAVIGPLADVPPMPPVQNKEWSLGDPAEYGFDADKLNAGLDEIFEDPLPDTRAVVLIRGGKLLAERYSPGFDRDMPLISASMVKSITGMMAGAAIHEGLFTLDDRAPIEQWSDAEDPRRDITWLDLIQMQSGLEFEEVYTSPLSDVAKMYMTTGSSAEFAINKPLIHEPGTHFAYSTGTSCILQRALRVVLEENGINYHTFPRDRIFEPLGMSSAVFSTDSVGDFIGGSMLHATARDFAKLGQLYLQDGVWEGERLLPEWWSEFVSTPASASSKLYGGQLWLNYVPDFEGGKQYFPGLPETAYWFSGYRGQVVLIVPSLDMVLVHLGYAQADRELVPTNDVIKVIMASLKQDVSGAPLN